MMIFIIGCGAINGSNFEMEFWCLEKFEKRIPEHSSLPFIFENGWSALKNS